jgi:hypothetical protein
LIAETPLAMRGNASFRADTGGDAAKPLLMRFE